MRVERLSRRCGVALAVLALVTAGVAANPGTTRRAHAATMTVPVMGAPVLNAGQLAAWYRSTGRTLAVPGVSVDQLAQLYIEEGLAEGIRGDLAFAQSVVETGYFGFVGSIVQPSNFNFAGMGACDSCGSGRQFPDPRTGVRAQIQHLRNYADAASRAANLRNAPVVQWYGLRTVNGVPTYDPALAAYNFDHFFAKGRAPTWNLMGNGNWATAPSYSSVVINVYTTILRWNGLPATAAMGATPIGSLDTAARVPGGVRVSGWALDPDSANPVSIHVYVNGVPMSAVASANPRPDVGAAYPGAGDNHGFDATVPTPGGTVCIYAINVGPGGLNPLVGCRSVSPSAIPLGTVDAVSRTPGGVRVRGWAIDPDIAEPVTLHVYVNGVVAGSITANATRPDVGAAFAGYGDSHGFDAVIPSAGGTVCVYAINAGPGAFNPGIGCRAVTGATAFGVLDTVRLVPGGVQVAGWAIDPDSGDPVVVHMYVNGSVTGAFVAGGPRPDVGAAFPGYGDTHGFDTVIPIPGGTVCVYAINIGAGTLNPGIGCRTT